MSEKREIKIVVDNPDNFDLIINRVQGLADEFGAEVYEVLNPGRQKKIKEENEVFDGNPRYLVKIIASDEIKEYEKQINKFCLKAIQKGYHLKKSQNFEHDGFYMACQLIFSRSTNDIH